MIQTCSTGLKISTRSKEMSANFENEIKVNLRTNHPKKFTLTVSNEIEIVNISSDEDNEFLSVRKKRLIVLNYSK